MSKIAEEKALKILPPHRFNALNEVISKNTYYKCDRDMFVRGYDQAAKDTIARIREKVNHLPNYLGDIRRCDINLILSKLEKEYE